MGKKIQHKRGMKVDLPLLSTGEIGFTTDTEETFIGTNNKNIRLLDDKDTASINNKFIELAKNISSVPIKETEQSTTPGREWSTSAKQLTYEINGDNVSFLTAPTNLTKRIVVLGSSTSEGYYANTGNSWFDKLKTRLENEGWSVLKRGLSGDTTTNAINRFYKDVVVFKPDICIIAFTIGNQGMNSSQPIEVKQTIAKEFKDNIFTLVMLCKQNGIVPVVADQSPTKKYDTETYNVVEDLNRDIESAGIQIINFKGAIDALLNNVPLSAAMHDDIHPNDVGHSAMYQAIPPSLFKRLAMKTNSVQHPSTINGAIRFPAATDITDTLFPIVYKPSDGDDIKTFTVFLRIKSTSTRTNQRAWLGIGNGELRVSNQKTNAFLDLRGSLINETLENGIISTTDINDLKEHSIAITYNSVSRRLKFYTDGNFVGEKESVDVSLTQVTVGSREGGTTLAEFVDLRHLAVYRVRLSNRQIMDMHQGHFYNGGLELFAPLHDATGVNRRLMNLAQTDSYAVCNTSKLIRV